MPLPPLPDHVTAIIRKPNPSVLGVTRPDGQAITFPVWYDLEGDRIMLNMTTTRAALPFVRANPRVSLTIIDGADWYTHVSLRGTVVDERDDPDLVDIDRISRRYRDTEYIWRIRNRVTMFLQVESWFGWGAAEASAT